ncbi:MAG TPA: AMP-binding protein [Thermoanaerobaculia bacterium]|nr:AMP-binding protein [Thermoanaerobaculia bacterium]
MQSRLRDRFASDPAAPCLGALAADGTPTWWTRGQVRQRLADRCRALREAGVVAGAACVLALPSTMECAELTLAVYLLGAVPLLVAPPVIQGANSSLLAILLDTLRRLRPRLAVCDPSLRHEEGKVAAASPATRVVYGAPPPVTKGTGNGANNGNGHHHDHGELPALDALAGDAIAGLQLTSGTTRSPRVCAWSHRAVLAALDGMAEAMALDGDDVCVNWTPLYHDMGLVNNLLLCASAGVPLLLMTPHQFAKRPALWLRALHAAGATVTWSPNFGFALASRASDRELEGVRLDRVRAFYNAAERIHPTTMERFRTRFAPYGLNDGALKANFGCAENVGGALFSHPREGWRSELLDADELERRGRAVVVPAGFPGRTIEVASVGRAAPGLAVEVLSPRGRDLGEGRVGELALRTASRMSSYLGESRATRRALDDGRLRTGDLAYRRGDDVFWVGRLRERINVAGRKLDPSHFEPLLFALPELRAGCMAVFGIESAEQGTQRVVVVAEVRDPATVDAAALREAVRSRVRLELGLRLVDVVLLPPGALAKTSSGKRRHLHVRRDYLEGKLQSL